MTTAKDATGIDDPLLEEAYKISRQDTVTPDDMARLSELGRQSNSEVATMIGWFVESLFASGKAPAMTHIEEVQNE